MTHVDQIGPIPEWIKQLRAPGYTNIFEICDPPTLFGTESLLGDWSGRLLILAQDFAPAARLRKLKSDGYADAQIYRHSDGDKRFGKSGLTTNENVAEAFLGSKTALDGRYALTSGIVYGSVCFFLKEGYGMSGKLTGFGPGHKAFDLSLEVLEHALTTMQNCRTVLLMGLQAQKAESVLKERFPGIDFRKSWHPNPRNPAKLEEFLATARASVDQLGVGFSQDRNEC